MRPATVVAIALAGSALTGAAMAQSTQLGIAACVGLCYVLLALLNLPLAVVLWLPLAALVSVKALNVGPDVAGLMILFGWFGAFAAPYSNLPAIFAQHAPLFLSVGAMVLWMLLSMAWAVSSPVGSDVFVAWLVAGAIVLVVSMTLADRRYVRLATAAVVVGVVVSVGIGLVGGAVEFEPGTFRIVGGSGDPNQLAAGIVPAIVLAIGLGAGSRHVEARVAVVIAVAVLIYGLVATQSRGGMIAAIVAAAAGLVLAKQHRGRVVVLLASVVGLAVVWASVDPVAWQRLLDLDESSGTGRSELWSVAWSMWQDHPFAGVGMQGFIDSAPSYARELGPLEYAEFLTEQPKVAHNTYLQLLAEYGIVGFTLYVGVVATCLSCAGRAAARFARMGDMPMVTLSRALIAALLAALTAAFFISLQTDRLTWVLLALGPALLAAARRQAAPELGLSRHVHNM